MSKTTPSWRAKLRYRFENTLSAGTVAIIAWLAIISLVVIVIAAFFIEVLNITNDPEKKAGMGFWEALWAGLMHALDAGTLGGDNGIPYRAVMFLVTIAGIFIVSTLIGVLTSGFSNVIDELRKGKTKVLEKNHTLILGWSPKVFDILNELILANESLRKAYVVILANRDKVEMEDEIRAKIPDTKTTHIICRTGSPLETVDVEVASPNEAKSIIILAPDDEPEPDVHVIKAVLALTNHPNRRAEPYHIVAEVGDEDNTEAALLVGGGETCFIFAEDLVSRITAQTCRQSGLSVVYTDLLGFEGNEIYFKEDKQWVGKTFKDTAFGYEKCSLIGIQQKAGKVLLNPAPDTILNEGDAIIVVAEDDSLIHYAPAKYAIDSKKISTEIKPRGIPTIERTLIIGWNAKGVKIVKELENYVAEGSEVVILTEPDGNAEKDVATLQTVITKQQISLHMGNFTKRVELQAQQPETFDHIVVLANEQDGVQEADAKTLIALLHLRNMAEQHQKDFAIVSEMRDIRNKYLAEIAKIDDFIVGANMISLILTQLSESKHLQQVFDNLFSADGSEIYLYPASDYVKVGEEVDFYTVTESAFQKNEMFIGYKIGAKSNKSAENYGIVMNPNKSAKYTFVEGDSLIVVADK
ncbi:MAG: potassium transporter TrkA [Bacteroidetes bacterium]|nr:MAG: potassium transporter TrkA [Bacteroidota bacterium]